MTPTPSRPTARHATVRAAAFATLLGMAAFAGTALAADANLAPIRTQVAAQHEANVKRLKDWNAGSYPGFVFTDPPLSLASGHFGMGYGTGAHAPDEYFVIESSNKNLDGFDGAAMSYVEYFYALAK